MTLPIWEFYPDWSSPPLDRYEWLTDVITSRAGYEQRAMLRDIPRRTMESSFTVHAGRLARLDAEIFGYGAQQMIVPIWQDQTALTEPLTSASTTMFCDTSSLEFTQGGYALIGDDITALTRVIVDTVNDTYIQLQAGPGADFDIGVKVYPARVARLISPLSQTPSSAGLVQLRPTFQIDDQPDQPGASLGDQFAGYYVFPYAQNWISLPSRTYTRSLDILDNSTGLPLWVDKTGFPAITRSNQFLVKTKAARAAWVQWAFFAAGKFNAYWKENREKTLQVTPRQNVAATSTLRIASIGFVDLLFNQPQRVALILRHLSGAVYYRSIVGASVDPGSGDELLELDSNIPGSSPADWLLISYMELVRQDGDAVEIAHQSVEVSQISLSFTGVRQ